MQRSTSLAIVSAWIMISTVAWSREPAEAFETWLEIRDISRYQAAEALAGTADPRARSLLEEWSRLPGEELASTRNAARIAGAKLSQPPQMEVATIVALPDDDPQWERKRIVNWASREALLDAAARRQLRSWPGLTDTERIQLAMSAWRHDRIIEDRAWLAEQLKRDRGDGSAALLLHEAGDSRGTAWLQRAVAENPGGDTERRMLIGLTLLLTREDFRSAAGFALLVTRELEGDGRLETSARNSALSFALRCGVPGASSTWLKRFEQFELTDEAIQRELLAAAMFTAGATPPELLMALLDSPHPDATSIGQWLKLVAEEHAPLSEVWRDWWSTTTPFAKMNTLIWPDDPYAMDAAIDRHWPSALAWVLGNPAADDRSHALAARVLIDWLESDKPERDARCAAWMTQIDKPISAAITFELAQLPARTATATKAALLGQPSFGEDDTAFRALLQTELRGGRVEDEARSGLELLRHEPVIENPAAIRAAWWLAQDEASR